MLKLPTMI